MAYSDNMDEFVSDRAYQQFEDVKKHTREIIDLMGQLSSSAKDAFDNLGGARTLSDYTTSASKAEDVTRQMATAQLNYNKLVQDSEDFLKSFGGTMEQNLRLYIQQKTELSNLAAQIKEITGQTNVYGEALGKNSDKLVQLLARQGELKASLKETQIAISAENKERIAAADSMDAMSQRLGRLRDTYRQLSAEERQSPIGLQTKQQIQELDAEMKKLDGELGNYFRNVGNYPNPGAELSAVKTQMVQLTLAGKDQSEEYQVLKTRATELKASMSEVNTELSSQSTLGDKLVSTFERMGLRFLVNMALFQSAFELISEIEKKIEDDINRAQLATNTIADVNSKASESYAETAINIRFMKDAFESATATMNDKKEIVEQLNQKYETQVGHIKDINDAEKFFRDKSGAFIKAMELRATATAAASIAAQKLIDYETTMAHGGKNKVGALDYLKVFGQDFYDNITGNAPAKDRYKAVLDNYVAEAKQDSDEVTKITEKLFQDAQKQADALDKQYGFNTDRKKNPKKTKTQDYTNAELASEQELTKQLYAELQKRIQQEAEAQKAIADDDTLSYEERIIAFKKYKELELAGQAEAISAQYDQVQQSLDKIAAIEKISADKRTKQENDLVLKKAALQQQLVSIEEQYNLLQVKNEEETAKGIVKIKQDEVKYIIDATRNITTNSDLQRDAELKNLGDQLEKGTLSYEQYTQKRKEIDDKYAHDAKQQIVEYLQDEINELSKQGYNVTSIQEALNKAKKALYDQDLQNFINTEKRKEDAERQLSDKVKQLVSESISTAQSLVDNSFQKQLQQDQTKLNSIQTNSQAEIQAIQNSGRTQQEKDKLINKINAETAAQTKQIQADENRIKRRQAIADKVAAEANIIQQTAVAAVSALKIPPPVGEELAAVITAIGAAQAIKAAATPIPQYKIGTDFHIGGFAVLGDGGEQELVKLPGGQSFWSEDKPTIYDLPRGTEVIPKHDIVAGSFSMNLPAMLYGNQEKLLQDINTSVKTLRMPAPVVHVQPAPVIFSGHADYMNKYILNKRR